MEAETWVALLDCNNFFVSCERLFRPDLKNQPVLVLSSNDGCVVARSQQVKDMGIPMGVPLFQVKDIIKDNGITVFSGNFALYRNISQRVMATLKSEFGNVDQYSVDEAFFTLSGTAAEVQRRARAIKDIVQTHIGIPVSVGVAATKTRAKLANAIAKKGDGVVVLSQSQWEALVGTTPVATIWGVGRQLSQRCHRHGIHTVIDLMNASLPRIEKLFGVYGARLWHELHGVSVFSVTSARSIPKSIMSSRSFGTTVSDVAVLLDALYYHVEQVAHDARRQGLYVGAIRVYVTPGRYSDYAGHGGSGEETFALTFSDTGWLIKKASAILLRLAKSNVPYKKIGVEISQLHPADYALQLPLWENHDAVEGPSLAQVIDDITAQYGGGVLQYGRVRTAAVWQAKSECKSPEYTTLWRDIPSVSA
jgi:DNA polymerase V